MNHPIRIIRSGSDYRDAVDQLAQLGRQRNPSDALDRAALIEAIQHWESICRLPASRSRRSWHNAA